MRQRGSITVFLSLILVCISALIFALLESARTAGVRYYLQTAADSAMDSLYSNFHKSLWEDYRLILYEGVDGEVVSKDYGKYIKEYIDNSNIYNLDNPRVEVMDLRKITDDSGFWFEKQVTEYMNYNLVDISDSINNISNSKEDVEQANIMQNITSSYANHTKEAVKVEKSLMRITDSFNKISDSKVRLDEAISQRDTQGCKEALSVIDFEISALDNKLKDYEKAADELDENLGSTEDEISADKEKLTDDNKEFFNTKISSYREYTSKDGERRLEVIERVEAAKENSQNMNERYEIIDRISELDEEDDADEIEDNWQALWESCNDISTPKIDASHGIADESKEAALESISQLLSVDIINLVLPDDRQLSLGTIDNSLLPSSLEKGASISAGNIADNLLINEYSSRFFADFTDNADKEFAYELEYIYAGFDTDAQNLSTVLRDILAVRTGLNYMHILTDSEKMDEVNNLAMAIAGVAGLPQISILISCLIISVWSLAESVADIRALLNNEKVAFIKTKEDWRLGLEGITGSKKEDLFDGDRKESGLDYESYIKFLLLTVDEKSRDYRMMDMIQNNIAKKESDFKMESMIHASRIRVYADSYRVFSNLSVGGGQLIGLSQKYRLYTEAIGAY